MRGCLQFLMKQEGYRYEENSWVPEQDVTAPDKLREFYRIHPGAPRRICSMAFQSLMSHASRMQHARRGVMSGDTPSHTSAAPDSTPPLGQNSTLLCLSSWNSAPLPFPNSAPPFELELRSAPISELRSTFQVGTPLHSHFQTLLHPQVRAPLHFHFWSYCGCEIACIRTPRVS